jgi:hypothetical protein
MRTAALSGLFALAALGAGGAAAQPQSLDRSSDMLDSMTRRLKLCAEIQDTAARLACYDRVESGGTAPAGSPPPAAAPAPTATPAPKPATPPPPTPPPAPPSRTAAPSVTSQPVDSIPDPSRVGKDDKPVPPEDRAFDPRQQGGAPGSTIGAAPGVVLPGQGPSVVEPQWRRIGAVPMRSVPGAQVPVVTLELPGLRPGPDYRWQLSMALANNTSRTFDVTIACAFNNGDRRVSDLTVILRSVRGGEKVGADVAGPSTGQFVDNAPCHIVSPLK